MPSLPDLGSLAAKALRLPSPATPVKVTRERDVRILTPDGASLLTDSWYPQGHPEAPVVLIRTPYGRGGVEAFLGGFLARHGFRCIIQSCRGTFGSIGPFQPFRTDADDAHTTVAWLRDQSWFAGKLATYGVSYAGYTAWTLAQNPPPELVAMVPVIAPTDPYSTLFPHGTMSAEVLLTWSALLPELPSRLKTLLTSKQLRQSVEAAALAMPSVSNYVTATGERKDFVEAWFEHEPDHSFWTDLDLREVLQTTTVPTLFVGGWHDIFTATMIHEFTTLRDRGVDTALVMAATTHSGHVRALSTIYRHVLPWLQDAFAGRRPAEAGTVTVQEVGTGAWRSLSQWPPADATSQRLFLHQHGELSPSAPTDTGGSDSFRYDPNDPTPAVGGELLSMTNKADNQPLEQRPDVVTYTGPVLEQDLLLGGASTVSLWWGCDGASFDVFARLLDVDPDGRSTTVTDAITRVVTSQPGAPELVTLELPPTYARLVAGHRLRLLVCAGAHPRFLRNHGTAEPLVKADSVVATGNTVHHDAAFPSAVDIRVITDSR